MNLIQDNTDFFETTKGEDPDEELEKIRESALRILDHADNTSAELIRKLLKKGYGRENVDSVVNALRKADLLNDERFAVSYARMKTEEGKGPFWIRQKLNEKGVPPQILDRALLEAEDREEEYRNCLLRALALCGLKYDFVVDSDGQLLTAEGSPYTLEKADVFGRKAGKAEPGEGTDSRRQREKERAKLARRLSAAGFSPESVRHAVSRIEDL